MKADEGNLTEIEIARDIAIKEAADAKAELSEHTKAFSWLIGDP